METRNTKLRHHPLLPLRVAITLALLAIPAPAAGQPDAPPEMCPQEPAPVAEAARDDVRPLAPPLLSAERDAVSYAHSPDTQGAQLAFEPAEHVLARTDPPIQLSGGDRVHVDAHGQGLLSFADPNLDNTIAWLVRIFKDSRSNLCTKASFNPDLPGPIFISLWLGALLGEATPANVAGRSVEVHTDYAVVAIPPAPSPPPDSTPTARDGLSMAQVGPNGNIPKLFVYHQPNLATWVVVLDGSAIVSAPGCDPDADPTCQVTVTGGQQTWVEPNQPPHPAVAATRANLGIPVPSIGDLTDCSVSETSVLQSVAPGDRPSPACLTPTPTPTPTFTPTPTPSGPHPFVYGTLLYGLDHVSKARDAHFTSMWAFVSWSNVEPNKGEFLFKEKTSFGTEKANALTNVVKAAREAKLRLVLRLDDPPAWAGSTISQLKPGDVEAYTREAVSYGSDVIDFVEVFNELNRASLWGDGPNPAAYVSLLRAAYNGAKSAKPSVKVVSAAPTQRTGGLQNTIEDVAWIDGMYESGGQQYFDALGMHAYLGTADPAADQADCGLCFRDIDLYRQIMDKHGDSKPAFITEMGAMEQATAPKAPIPDGFVWMQLDPKQRADHLVKALQIAYSRYPWLLGAMISNLDFATPGYTVFPEQPWFALLNPDLTPRLAYTRFQGARASGDLPDQ